MELYAIILGEDERSDVVKKALMALGLVGMLAAMMIFSGVAHARTTIGGPTQAQCKNLAIKTIGPGFDPSGYTFVVGTSGDDTFTDTAGKREVFCGFGGDDSIDTIESGDIFIGGDGNDQVITNNGTFYGGAGDDSVNQNHGGTFYGGAGNDYINNTNDGIFYGGDGNDYVYGNFDTFYGGAGDDYVVYPEDSTGTFVD